MNSILLNVPDTLYLIEGWNPVETGKLFIALLEYGKTEVEPKLAGTVRTAFRAIRGQVDRANQSYETKTRNSRENGKLGGRPKKPVDSSNEPENQQVLGENPENQQVLEKPNVNVNVNVEAKASYAQTAGAASAAGEPSVFLFPLADGTEYPVFQAKVDQWRGLFPAIDVEQQLRLCLAWNIDNPKRRKTSAGILRHISQWLARAQDNPSAADKLRLQQASVPAGQSRPAPGALGADVRRVDDGC